MRIREFVYGDYEAAARLWERAEGMQGPSRDEVKRKLERDPELFLVAEDDGTLVGVVIGTYDGRRGWIFRLAVDPVRRRERIGVQLIAELERRFDAMDVQRIRVLVHEDSMTARTFWKAAGYDEYTPIVLATKDLDHEGPPDDPC